MLPMVGDELLPLVGLLALRRDLGCGSRRPFDRDPIVLAGVLHFMDRKTFPNDPVSGSGLHVTTNVNSPFPRQVYKWDQKT